ncbi:hypothetical protein GJ496_008906 [Pomphorhynchus laevis]|nr:hypothetical protein GJ496_008906 [Pomphorhynchus laevis]
MFELDDSKAGMQSIDKDQINKIIEDTSRLSSSNYYEYQQRQLQRINERIEERKLKISEFSSDDFRRAQIQADLYIKQLDESFVTSSTFVHFDLDAFFCAVEMLENPKLTEIPMAVGTDSMLCTSNYPARKFGVRAAMPGFIAKRICPNLVIIRPHREKYVQASKIVMNIFKEYDPDYLAVSVDEAYVNLTDYLKRHPHANAFDIVNSIRQRVKVESKGLTVSAGIACNPRLSKLCTDIKKPDGQFGYWHLLNCQK